MGKAMDEKNRGYVDSKIGSVVVKNLKSYEQKLGKDSSVYKEAVKQKDKQ